MMERTTLLDRVAESLLDLEYHAWRFGDSVAFQALVELSRVRGGEWGLGFARGFVRGWAASDRPLTRLDCTAPGLAMVDIYRATGDDEVLRAALDLGLYLVARPRIADVFATWESSPLQRPYGGAALPPEELVLLAEPPAGIFVDCLHFDPPFFAALGDVTGEQQWTDEAVRQALGYIAALQGADGLFDHFVLEGSARSYGPGWGRGQGWALLGLLDVIGLLPKGHDRRADLVTSARTLSEAMIALQRRDGHWSAVVNDPESGEESSTAAFMAYGLRRAHALGVAPDTALEAAERALDAAVASTDDAGRLLGVSAAVNACTAAEHYAHVPTGFVVPWGQGPLALALIERLAEEV